MQSCFFLTFLKIYSLFCRRKQVIQNDHFWVKCPFKDLHIMFICIIERLL